MQLFIIFLLVVIGVVVIRKKEVTPDVIMFNKVNRLKHDIERSFDLRVLSVRMHELIEESRKTTNVSDWVEQELETAYAKRKEQLNNFYKVATA